MARFYATVENERGTTKKQMGRKSIETHTRGWEFGVRVIMDEGKDGKDMARIYLTRGSNHPTSVCVVGEFNKDSLDNTFQVINIPKGATNER